MAGGADGWDCGLLGASWAQSVACRKEVTWVKVDQVVAVGTDGQMWAQDPIGTISGTCSRRTDRRWEQTGFRQQVQQDRQTSDGLNSPPGSGSTDRQMDVGLVVGRCSLWIEAEQADGIQSIQAVRQIQVQHCWVASGPDILKPSAQQVGWVGDGRVDGQTNRHRLGGSDIQHVVQVGDVADSQAKDLNLGELLVGRQRGQQLAQLGEGHVEGFHADAFPRGVGCAVLGRGSPPPPPLLPAQVLQVLLHRLRLLGPAGLRAQSDAGLLRAAHAAAVAEDGFGLGVRGREVELCLLRVEHGGCGWMDGWMDGQMDRCWAGGGVRRSESTGTGPLAHSTAPLALLLLLLITRRLCTTSECFPFSCWRGDGNKLIEGQDA